MVVPAVVATVLLAGATPSRALDNPDQAIVKVPFRFVVGGTMLPAGQYEVKAAEMDPSVLRITSLHGDHQAEALTMWGGRLYLGDHPQLLFKVYGGTHFLSYVRLPGEDGRMIPLSRTDVSSELARLATRRQEHAEHRG